jgi:hypothetical protein
VRPEEGGGRELARAENPETKERGSTPLPRTTTLQKHDKRLGPSALRDGAGAHHTIITSWSYKWSKICRERVELRRRCCATPLVPVWACDMIGRQHATQTITE